MFKPRLRLTTVKKASRHKSKQKSLPMPKLITIGNSVGLVIGKALLESIGWKKGDTIDYRYSDFEKTLFIRNLSAEQREYNVIHKTH